MSKIIKISTIYRVSVANVMKESSSDFLDALTSDPNANYYYFGLCGDASKVIAYHEDLGNVVIDAESIDEAVDEFLKLPLKAGYPEPILKPLMLSAIHNDTEILAEAFEKETFRFYSVRNSDDVEEYKSRIEGLDAICGFGAVSYDIGANFNLDTKKISYNGEYFKNLEDLHGYFGEDSWVVVLRPYQSKDEDFQAISDETPEKGKKTINQYCTECGASLIACAKFCASCGAKVAEGMAISSMPLSEFKKTALANDKFKTLVSGVELEGPDSEGNYSVSVKYRIENSTAVNFGSVLSHVALINSDGFFIEESEVSNDELRAGEFSDLESYFWGIPKGLLGKDLTNLSVMIEATGCSGSDCDLGLFDVPESANQPIAIPSFEFDMKLRCISGSIWKSAPDRDKDVSVNTKISLQNLTDTQISYVKLNAKILNASGEEIADLSGSGNLKPCAITALGGYGFEKEKSLKAAKVQCSVSYGIPVAKSYISHTGSNVAAVEDE